MFTEQSQCHCPNCHSIKVYEVKENRSGDLGCEECGFVFDSSEAIWGVDVRPTVTEAEWKKRTADAIEAKLREAGR